MNTQVLNIWNISKGRGLGISITRGHQRSSETETNGLESFYLTSLHGDLYTHPPHSTSSVTDSKCLKWQLQIPRRHSFVKNYSYRKIHTLLLYQIDIIFWNCELPLHFKVLSFPLWVFPLRKFMEKIIIIGNLMEILIRYNCDSEWKNGLCHWSKFMETVHRAHHKSTKSQISCIPKPLPNWGLKI